MKGIYKITSPSGNVYIGQSVNIKERWSRYKKRGAKNQHALQRSFLKYGVDAHVFEIAHELPNDCEQDIINAYEQLYIEQYINCGFIMLNLKFGGGGGGKLTQEIKDKIGKANKKNKPTKEQIAALVARLKGKPSWNKGKKYKLNLSEEERARRSLQAKNRKFKHTVATRIKMSVDRKGKNKKQDPNSYYPLFEL